MKDSQKSNMHEHPSICKPTQMACTCAPINVLQRQYYKERYQKKRIKQNNVYILAHLKKELH